MKGLPMYHRTIKSFASQKKTLQHFDTVRLSIIAICLCLIIFLFIPRIHAETAAVDEMNLVCNNWLTKIVFEKGQWAGQFNPKVANIVDIEENDTLLALCYNIDPDGFIIVPVLKNLPPVKVYTDEGNFNPDDPGFPQMIKEVLLDRTRVYVNRYGSLEALQPEEGDIFLDKRHREQWDNYTVPEAVFSRQLNKSVTATDETVGPLLTTRWHQNAPYNNYCPMGDGGRTVVGCVATAAAQIFAYYQWPPSGEGSESYTWTGDFSCGGSSDGQRLTADFSDPYDWPNMVNYCSGCTIEQQNALAELNYEVGVAFHMDYGRCGSAIYLSQINFVMQAFHEHFRYMNTIDREDRDNHTAMSWFNLIKSQINSGYVMEYFISRHAIVCDGWQTIGDINQYHMNYGWGGSYNAWFTLDNTYCNWDGCSYLSEFLFRNIIPDQGVQFTADTTFGWAPFEVNFEGFSDLEVDSWNWDFGDGEYSSEQSPTHIYLTPGTFDVRLDIVTGGENRFFARSDFIIVLADTLSGNHVESTSGSIVEFTVNAINNIPLQRLQIPVEYSGPVSLKYKGYSSEGCRTEGFNDISYLNYDAGNKRLTINMEAGSSTVLSPGSGPVIKLSFEIDSAAAKNSATDIIFDGYTTTTTYLTQFYGYENQYEPVLISGLITSTGCCKGMTGNVDCSEIEEPDIADITRLIDFLYTSHTPLCCPDEADCDGSGGTPDISDITALINYLYLSHNPVVDCPL